MASPSTDALYNSDSRLVQWKLDCYFNGANNSPTTFTQDDYLITSSVLEELSADTSAPFSTVSANELSFELANKDSVFSPLNTTSMFYNKIKVGLMIKAYCRIVTEDKTYDWDPLGVFYLSDWQTGFTGQTVTGTATDKISNLINATKVKLAVYENITFNNFIQKFFTKIGESVTLDSALTGTLKYGYHTGQNVEFLNNVAGGLQVFIYCDHSGAVVCRKMHKTMTVAHTITDDDQIVTVTTKQSILYQYDGCSVCAKIPQLSDIVSLYSESDIDNTTLTTYEDRTFSNMPVVNVVYGAANGDSYPVIDGLSYDATELKYTLAESFRGRVEFYGQYIQTIELYKEDKDCKNALKFSSIYIQTQDQLNAFKGYLDAYVDKILPVIELTVKGNPRFQLGEKIEVNSSYFQLRFTGVLLRQELTFNGGLSATITLVDATILEV